jgi:hypothetical protein
MDGFRREVFSAYIGLDWANAKHEVCIQAADSDAREFSQFAHKPSSIDQWANGIHQRFGGVIAIALELAKGPIVYALQKYDFIVLFPINPTMLARYREAFKPSYAKDDPTDAEHALELLLRHRDKLKRLEPQSAEMRTLICLAEQRRRLVGDLVRFTNRLGDALKQYYPQALEWFPERDTFLFCDFLTRWPTLRRVRSARTATLTTFFHDHNVRSADRIDKRISAIKAATTLTNDPAIIAAYQAVALALVEQLRVTLKAVYSFDKQIAALAATLPDYVLFSSLPGAGAHWRRDCWSHLVRGASDFMQQSTCSGMRAWRP